MFAFPKTQNPVADASLYYISPQAAAAVSGVSINLIATPQNPAVAFLLPDPFYRAFGSESANGRGEIREEYCTTGGVWPSNTQRVITFHGGRTPAGLAGNYLNQTLMSNSRTMLGTVF